VCVRRRVGADELAVLDEDDALGGGPLTAKRRAPAALRAIGPGAGDEDDPAAGVGLHRGGPVAASDGDLVYQPIPGWRRRLEAARWRPTPAMMSPRLPGTPSVALPTAPKPDDRAGAGSGGATDNLWYGRAAITAVRSPPAGGANRPSGGHFGPQCAP